jgi:hypothetical protein
MPIGVMQATYQKLEEGVPIKGQIVDFRVEQTANWDTKRPKYFKGRDEVGDAIVYDPWMPDGTMREPVCQWVITLDIGIEDEHGDTERRIFIDPRVGKKGTAVEGKRGKDAIGLALKRAKAHRVGLEIGGTLSITYTGQVRPGKGEAACNTYTAEYEPPAGGPGTGEALDEVPWMIGGGRFNPHERLAPVGAQTATTTTSGGGQVVFDDMVRAGVSTTPAVEAGEPPF